MLKLKNHPFAVEAFFENSTVLTYAVPKEQLSMMLPEKLELDLFENQWAFIAVAIVKTKALRPKGFPGFMGNNFFLVGYRIFVRYTTIEGKKLRGLYILKSDTDRKKMELLGNIFTHYKYTTTDIAISEQHGIQTIRSVKSDFLIKTDLLAENIPLPSGSPFTDWKEARRFAGPLPFTFTYNTEKKQMLIIEGVRQNWTPAPIRVIEARFAFLDELGLRNTRLANAFTISNIPYYWKKGKIESWK
jgi:uncharacterized protein YqjF (DUF2071 family)